ncbi:MAG TPA: ACT domain-containing protein [Candidatus Wallbacteria bacterium]|nr:MAG: hypothetical protein BWY32_00358 [bacterium ADurb.Bin243]HOT77513.1 ACT domain-containing protein [Candidatus Wallbacteria bacterium]HPG59154.1 ACT domain-containing protein [Candidatus Wallbacteria bacterium]
MDGQDRVVVSVIGVNRVGIVSKISTVVAELNASILDISQTLIGDLFSMIMIIDVAKSNLEFKFLREKIENAGNEMGVKAIVLHENTFRYMHRV